MTTGHGGPTIAILGAGAAGLCMGIRLRQAGIRSFAIYEKSQAVGGTWLDNSYPGAGCDVPSHLYCFSFAPNPDWSRRYSEQPEIRDYLERCADEFGLGPHLRFGVEIAGLRFDEGAGLWRLRTRSGEEITANVVVSGTGQLNRPHVPDLEGLDRFAGVRFHSARWNHEIDLAGRDVAVVGNGASAIQFVPRIAERARRVTICQRSANWVVPRNDRPYGAFARALFRRVPAALRLHRAFLYLMLEVRYFGFIRHTWVTRLLRRAFTRSLHRVIADQRLRAALTPDYPPGCKRVLISDDYYQSLTRPNVAVVTSAIERIAADGVLTVDGTHHPADVLIFATGFETTAFLAPMEVVGRGGRTLAEAWHDGAEAYFGIAVAGFPNLFLLYGPNTNLGHNSILFMIECQVAYVLRCLEGLRARGGRWLDVHPGAMAAYNRRLQRDLARTTWAAGCESWYKTAAGRITNNWSGLTLAYWWRTLAPELADFEVG